MNRFNYFIKQYRRFGLQSILFLFVSKFKKNKLANRRISGVKYPISLSNYGPDVMTLFQIYFGKEYEMPFAIEPEYIIDCGANIGLSAVYYANHYPNAKIIAIEPDDNNFRFLQQNTIYYSNVVCLKKAIWSEKKQIELIDIGTGNWSLQSKEVKASTPNSIEAIGIMDLVEEYGINEIGILKVDIEGAEKQLFSENYESWLKITKSIAIELHPNIDHEIPAIFNHAIKNINCKKYHSGENLICDLRNN